MFLCVTFLACSLIRTTSIPCNIAFYPEETQCNPRLNVDSRRVITPLFTGVRGIGILRTSPFGDSPKLDFRFTEFSEVQSRISCIDCLSEPQGWRLRGPARRAASEAP